MAPRRGQRNLQVARTVHGEERANVDGSNQFSSTDNVEPYYMQVPFEPTAKQIAFVLFNIRNRGIILTNLIAYLDQSKKAVPTAKTSTEYDNMFWDRLALFLLSYGVYREAETSASLKRFDKGDRTLVDLFKDKEAWETLTGTKRYCQGKGYLPLHLDWSTSPTEKEALKKRVNVFWDQNKLPVQTRKKAMAFCCGCIRMLPKGSFGTNQLTKKDRRCRRCINEK